MKHFITPRSIGQRFALAIGTGAGVILVVLALANYLSGRELLLQQTSSEALKEVHDEMRAMDDLVDRIAMLPAVIGATQVADGGVTVPWLASVLESCPIRAVYGLYMVLDNKDWRDPASDIWVDRKSWPHLARLKYDFHDPSQDWYHGAKENKGKRGLHVTQPYFDAGGSDIDMISITKPIYGKDGSFIGVAGVDVALDEMRKIVRKMHIRDFGTDVISGGGKVTSITNNPKNGPKNLRESAYLISQTGAIIVSPEEAQETPPTALPEQGAKDHADALTERLAQGLVTSLPGIREILSTPNGWLRLEDGSNKVIYWAEGRNTGWKLVLEVPYEMIVAPARNLAEQSAMIGGVGLLLLLGVVFFVARKVSGPITELQSVAANFEKGTYDEGRGVLERIETRPDELGRFARSFSAMAGEIRLREQRLSEWNVNLERTVKDRTADLARAMGTVEKANAVMAAELSEAAAYSRAVLPSRMDDPVRTDWVFVTSSQLGGDSFGYHWLDHEHLSLYLLDVCGHGVGAALLSISVVNMLRTASLADTDFHDPAAVLGNLNASFPMEQHNDMYFTAWYGVYSLSTGELRFACGGHPPAVLVSQGGFPRHLAAKGPVVGAFPKARYETNSVMVDAGSRLYLFSDGAYEIDRPGSSMMTYEEFSQLLSSLKREATLDFVVAEVRRQQGSEAFADDFSLVEFQFMAPQSESHGTLRLSSELSELGKLHGFLKDFCAKEGAPVELAFDFEVILEELATNVMKYGGITPGSECCLIELSKNGNLVAIRFSDAGTPFNPLEQDEVDTNQPIEDRPIGGLGIHFIKALTDTQSYDRQGGRNVLTLTKELRS